MSLKIVVLAKQVPDTHNVGADAMNADGTVNRAALPTVFNPEDLKALEMALQVKDQVPGSTVTVVTMGPPRAAEIIKDARNRGADDGFVLSDARFAGADTLATSYALSQAIRQVGHVDLIFGGRQAIDGDTAQVGPQVAEKLDIPQVTYAEELLAVEMQELQDLGYDLSMTGFDEKELADLFSDGTGSDAKDDDFDLTAALEKASFVERGDVWMVGRHRLMCGDATRAVIIETYGSGNAPSRQWFLDIVQEAAAMGKVLMNVTQCMSGTVNMDLYATGKALEKAGVVSGRDITTEGALAKLFYLLGKGRDNTWVKAHLGENIMGEISL